MKHPFQRLCLSPTLMLAFCAALPAEAQRNLPKARAPIFTPIPKLPIKPVPIKLGPEPILAPPEGGSSGGAAPFVGEIVPFRFDFPGNTSTVGGDLGDLGYYDLRDGGLILYAQHNSSLEGSANNSKVVPNLLVKNEAIPADWFIETKVKVNFDQFDREAHVGLIVGSDADNYCALQIKHDLSNTDYLNVAFESGGQLTPQAVQDGHSFLGVNYGPVTLRIQHNPDRDSIQFLVTRSDGSTLTLPEVTQAGNPALYAQFSSLPGKRIGFYADSGGHWGIAPASFQNFRTNLPTETPKAASAIYKQDFLACDTALSFQVPGAINPNSEAPEDYVVAHSEFDVLLNPGIHGATNNPRNLINLRVQDGVKIPDNWFVKVRVNTNFNGVPSNPWAGMILMDDADNWIGFGRKHSAFGGSSIDYASLTTELNGRTSNDVAQFAYPFIDPESGAMTLTMQHDPVTGKIALTFQGANGDGNQFGYLRDGDTRYGGTPRGQFYVFAYNFLKTMNGKRIGFYGDNDYSPNLRARYDYLMTNLPLELPTAQPISGKLEFQSLNPSKARDQKVTFKFLPLDPTKPAITRTIAIPPTGEFRFESIPAGECRMFVQCGRYLQRVRPVDTRAGAVAGLNLKLLVGDINGDNVIDGTDLGLLLDAYNAAAGSPLYTNSALADLDQNGFIDVDDLTLLLSNYRAQGEN